MIDLDSTVSSQFVELNFGTIYIEDETAANIVVGERSIDLFHSPDTFPMVIGDVRINLLRQYGDATETMVLHRYEGQELDKPEATASIDTMDMTDYQQSVAFLYLVGKVMADAS